MTTPTPTEPHDVRAAVEKILRWGIEEAREREAIDQEAENILIARDVERDADDYAALDAVCEEIEAALSGAVEAGIAHLAAVSAAAPDERELVGHLDKFITDCAAEGVTKGVLSVEWAGRLRAALASRPTTPTPTVSEWGMRCELDGEVSEAEDREDAERIKAHHDAGLDHGHVVVRREVTPWVAVTTDGGEE